MHSSMRTRTLYKTSVPGECILQKIRYEYDTRTIFLNSRWPNYFYLSARIRPGEISAAFEQRLNT